jgi:hypothetical protein
VSRLPTPPDRYDAAELAATWRLVEVFVRRRGGRVRLPAPAAAYNVQQQAAARRALELAIPGLVLPAPTREYDPQNEAAARRAIVAR